MLVSSRLTMHQGLTPGPEVDKLRLDGQALLHLPGVGYRGGENFLRASSLTSPVRNSSLQRFVSSDLALPYHQEEARRL